MYSSVTNTEPRGAATENGWATTDISLSQDICELLSVHETPVLNKALTLVVLLLSKLPLLGG